MGTFSRRNERPSSCSKCNEVSAAEAELRSFAIFGKSSTGGHEDTLVARLQCDHVLVGPGLAAAHTSNYDGRAVVDGDFDDLPHGMHGAAASQGTGSMVRAISRSEGWHRPGGAWRAATR